MAQLHGDARVQLVEVEGLGQVVVGPQFEQRHFVGCVCAGRHHDHGRVAFLADGAHDVLAGRARQHEVGDDEVVGRLVAGFGRPQQKPRLAARVRLHADVPRLGKRGGQHVVDVGVVLDDEYARGILHGAYCSGIGACAVREPACRGPCGRSRGRSWVAVPREGVSRLEGPRLEGVPVEEARRPAPAPACRRGPSCEKRALNGGFSAFRRSFGLAAPLRLRRSAFLCGYAPQRCVDPASSTVALVETCRRGPLSPNAPCGGAPCVLRSDALP